MVDACAWKSGANLVPQDQIEWLLSLLLEAEKRRWLANISPVNSSERDTQPDENRQRNYSFVDAGSHLLRHGRCIDQIHDDFRRFEPNHYCLQATTNSRNPDRPSSQIKLVSNEEHLSDSTRTSVSPTSSYTKEPSGGLTTKSPLFELYKNSILCAKYPVLSAISQPASPSTPYSPAALSPIAVSTSMQARRFSFSRVPSSSLFPTDAKLKKNGCPASASSDGCVSPEVSLPISSDALQELLMNVFALRKREHKYYCETIIPQQVPLAKEPQRLLVTELQSQRVVLERNHHPFYRVQAFMDKNAYEEWLIMEKEKIEHLIRSFWHNILPPLPELPLENRDFHRQYLDLMERLIRYESKNKEPHPVHGGMIPTAPLSSQACRLLKEFQLRYGVGLFFCKISYLDYLVKYLENELWYLQHVTYCLQDVMTHALHLSRPETYVEKQFKLLLSILSDLLGKTKYSLTRIRKIFPENIPKDGLPALVALFEISLESARQLQLEFSVTFSALQQAQEFANSLPTEHLSNILASFLKTEMESRYERLKVIATDELHQNFLSPQLLLKLILEIRLEVRDYNTSYKMAFSSYFDVMELAAVEFYSLLMSDVEQLCADPPQARRHHVVEPNMLCLAFRLSQLDKDWAKFIPLSHQIWRQPFQEFALLWLDVIGRSFQNLVPHLTSHEAWSPAEVNFSSSQKRTRTRSQGRPIPCGPLIGTKSASVLSLTPSKHSAFNTVGPSTSAPTKTITSKRMVNGMGGKEPIQPRKNPLGSSPPKRARSPKRKRPGKSYESSSEEEDTPSMQHASSSRSPTKANHVQRVVAQIHEPRGKAGPNGKVKNSKQPSHQEESKMKATNAMDVDKVNKEESSTSLEVKPDTKQSSRDLVQGVSSASNKLSSSNAQDLPGNTGDMMQFGNCDEPDDHGDIKVEKEENDYLTTASTMDSYDYTKPGSSDHGHNKNYVANSEKLEDAHDDPEVEPSGTSAQSQHALKVSDVDKAEQNAVSSQSGLVGVQPLGNQPNETDMGKPQGSQKSVEATASIKSPESLQQNCVMQLPGNEEHSEVAASRELDQQIARKVEGQSSESVHTLQTKDVGEVSDEHRFSSDSGSGTPFENDSSDESDSNTLLHPSGSFDSTENDGKAKMLHEKDVSVDNAPAGMNALPNSHQQEPQEDQGEGGSKLSSAPELCPASITKVVKPVEGGGVSSEGQGGSDSCENCPGSSSCTQGGRGLDENKQTAQVAMDPKVVHQRQSAPVNIPATRHNNLITRLLDTPRGSVGSTISEAGSFASASGSFHSGYSIESFHTAQSKSSSSQFHQSKRKENGADPSEHSSQPGQSRSTVDSDDHSDKAPSADDAHQVVPISSSFVDVMCAVNRLTAFVCHLCKILCPDENLQRDEHTATADDELTNESLCLKRRLCTRLIQVILSFVKLYSDNVLGMETCGLPEEHLAEILDERVQRHLSLQREAGLLRGCRYNPLVRQCCNTRDSNGMFIRPCEGILQMEANPGQYEPLTKQMGVRISSVAILRSILPWLAEHVTAAVSNPDAMLSAHHHYVSSTASELSHSLSYCENGPSLDGVTNNSTAEAARCSVPQPRSDVLLDPGMLNGETEHFCRLETAQLKLVTFRINKFFKQVLRNLLDLNLPRYSIQKRLRPAMGFLSRELRRFHGVLYPDCFNKLLTDFWAAVAQNFKEESDRLVRKGSSAVEHSKLLAQAVACLMQFFHAEGVGLACDKLAAPMDAIVKQLQLYTSPTEQLISTYHSLYKQVLIMQQQYRVDELTSSVSISSHQPSANAPADFVIQALCKDLHTTRKCFSGVQLVEWVEDYVRNNGLDNLGVCIGNTETETALELGQYLLERGMIICISPPPLFNQQTPTDRRREDEPVYVDNTPAERGTVFISEQTQPDIRINNISVATRNNTSSRPASSSSSTSRSTMVNESGDDEADDEYDEDDDNFLGSGSDLWNRVNSVLSEREATFYNHPKAYYKFISEEDSSRTDIKISLGINDRLNLPGKLKHILCVLYARRDSDRNARNFLRRLPRPLLEEALGGEMDIMCFSGVLRVCQTS